MTARVGCFELEQLGPLRWRCTNTLNGYAHVTYGTEDEVRDQLSVQSAAWELRVANGEERHRKGKFSGGPKKPRAGAAT